MSEPQEAPLRSERDIVLARQLVRRKAQEAGLSLDDQTMIVTAGSELDRYALIFGGGGVMVSEIVTNGLRRGVKLQFRDEGPGISDLELAMRDGWTSGNGLGMGLSGAKR